MHVKEVRDYGQRFVVTSCSWFQYHAPRWESEGWLGNGFIQGPPPTTSSFLMSCSRSSVTVSTAPFDLKQYSKQVQSCVSESGPSFCIRVLSTKTYPDSPATVAQHLRLQSQTVFPPSESASLPAGNTAFRAMQRGSRMLNAAERRVPNNSANCAASLQFTPPSTPCLRAPGAYRRGLHSTDRIRHYGQNALSWTCPLLIPASVSVNLRRIFRKQFRDIRLVYGTTMDDQSVAQHSLSGRR
jgi:hypothetical protein